MNYHNIENIKGVPEYDEYHEQIELDCRADTFYNRVIISGVKWEDEDSQFIARVPIKPLAPEEEKLARKAISYYSELIQNYDFNRNRYRLNRIDMYTRLEAYELAEADLNYQLATYPDNYWILESRAILYVQMGQTDLALTDYENLLAQVQLHPEMDNQAYYIERFEQAIAKLELQ